MSPGLRPLRASLGILTLGVLGVCSGCGDSVVTDPGSPADPSRSNLVVVLSDALRAASLPSYGYPRQTAPFLTRLADESLLFTDHLANYPGTPVSISQLMTGRLMPPLLMGGDWALAPVRRVEADLPILPRILGETGYSTGLVSSHAWFDESAKLLEHFESVSVIEPPDGEVYAPFADLLGPAFDFLEARARDGRPFFLYLHSLDTHAPFHLHEGHEPPPVSGAWPEVYDRYDSEILYTDHGVERLVTRLKDLGLWQRTIFVFTSDHGEDHNELGPEWWNKAHGSSLHRSQLHIPLIIHSPDPEDVRGRFERQSRHIDLLPTLLSLLALSPEGDRYRFDGRNLLAGEVTSEHGRADEGFGEGSLAYSWRYWSLYRGPNEAIYDQWTDRLTLYRSVPDERNYPIPEEIQDPKLTAELAGTLSRERRRHMNGFLSLPPQPPDRAIVGIPTTVVHGESRSLPTFFVSPSDGLWSLQIHKLLLCHPGEEPGRLVLATPWAPGAYRVEIRSPLRTLFPARVRIRFLGGGNPPVEVDFEDSDDEGWVPLGIQNIGDLLKVEFSEPRGGVAFSAFRLERIGAETLPPSAQDENLEKRLRALGYVQ